MQKTVFIRINFCSKDKGIYFGIRRMLPEVIFHKVLKLFFFISNNRFPVICFPIQIQLTVK